MPVFRDGTALQDCGTKDTPPVQKKAKTALAIARANHVHPNVRLVLPTQPTYPSHLIDMSGPITKNYLFASDFDQTLSFNDSGLVLTELLGIPVEDFKRKAAGMAKLNLVQQGAELAYLL